MLTLHPETLRQPAAARVRAARLELAAALEQERDDLLLAIANAYPGDGEVFTSSGLWAQPDLRARFEAAGLHSVKQLGRWLQQSGLVERIDRDGDGIVWTVSADDLHDDAGDS